MALSKRTLVRWLLAHGFTEVPRRATSHRRFRQAQTTITVADHGRPQLSTKHTGMLLRELTRDASLLEQLGAGPAGQEVSYASSHELLVAYQIDHEKRLIRVLSLVWLGAG